MLMFAGDVLTKNSANSAFVNKIRNYHRFD